MESLILGATTIRSYQVYSKGFLTKTRAGILLNVFHSTNHASRNERATHGLEEDRRRKSLLFPFFFTFHRLLDHCLYHTTIFYTSYSIRAFMLSEKASICFVKSYYSWYILYVLSLSFARHEILKLFIDSKSYAYCWIIRLL